MVKTSKVLKNRPVENIAYTFPQPCVQCIETCAKSKDNTPCMAYQVEDFHRYRMVVECPLLVKTLEDIFSNIVNRAKIELDKRGE